MAYPFAFASRLGLVFRMFVLMVALGLAGALAGCADIHPEGNDVEGGMIDSPTQEADQFRQHEERANEGENRQR